MIISGPPGRVLAGIIFRHRGHDVRCVTYGDSQNPDNFAIECADCGEVLIDTSEVDYCSVCGMPKVPDSDRVCQECHNHCKRL